LGRNLKMRVYFFRPEINLEKNRPIYQNIAKKLEAAGLKVVTKEEDDSIFGIEEREVAKIQASGESILNYVDGIVMETTADNPEIGYLLAHAVLQKKPTLCLYQKGSLIKKTLSRLGQKIPDFIKVMPYQEEELDKTIAEYIQLFGMDPELSEVPNIKFTLRISKKISHFLHWKTHNTKKTKADFLRELIQEIIDKDEKYQKYMIQRKSK